MNLLKKGVKLFIICTVSVVFANSAFSQNPTTTDTSTINAIDTLNFDNISNEAIEKPAPAAPAQTAPAIDNSNNVNQADTSNTAAPATGEPAPATTTTTATDTTGTPSGSDASVSSGSSSSSGLSDEAPRARQRTFTGLKKFRNITVGANIGMAKLSALGVSDFRKNNSALGYGLNLSYYLGRSFSLRGDFNMFSEMSGDSITSQVGPYNGYAYKFSGMDFSINGVFTLGNISYISKKNRVAIYASVGAGMVSYTSERTETKSPLFKVNNKKSTVIIPVGIGLKYKITNELSANVGHTIRFTDTDGLDNTYVNGNMDNYSYTYLGITYLLGKKNKPSIEWTNPIITMFDDLSGNAQNAMLRKKVVSLQDQMDSLEMRLNSRIDSLKADADGDGIPDYTDREGETPKGAMVDATGKALDSDGDGIIDFYDRCPFEKGTAAFNGCKKMPVKISRKDETTVRSAENKILFPKNSQKLTDDSKKALDNIVNLMQKNQGYKLLISGYTDADGDKALNERLSAERASAVKRYLVEQGIAENRLKTQGLGEKVFLDNNITSAGKQQNRAVTLEFVVF